ncbi:hypothetical protein BDF20DRAFT_820422, partial [Mycotypha africana]|uniref:uncharacterized protein n=1 Tax=Mycotypha africana TaxID=64632 RepID=UPI0022FFF67B
ISWCERQLQTQVETSLKFNGYSFDDCERKFSDGLGVSVNTNDEELFIECSSGIDKEIVLHTLKSTIKMIVECSNAMNYIIQKK